MHTHVHILQIYLIISSLPFDPAKQPLATAAVALWVLFDYVIIAIMSKDEIRGAMQGCALPDDYEYQGAGVDVPAEFTR